MSVNQDQEDAAVREARAAAMNTGAYGKDYWDVERFSNRQYALEIEVGARGRASFRAARERVLAFVAHDPDGNPAYLLEQDGTCDVVLNRFLVDAAALILSDEVLQIGGREIDAYIAGCLAAVSSMLTTRWFERKQE